MLGKTYDTQVCSIARSLEMVGERWSLLIIRDALFARVTRFGDFQHNLGIATNVLTSRLESFVAAGIMARDGAVDYVLTTKGRALASARPRVPSPSRTIRHSESVVTSDSPGLMASATPDRRSAPPHPETASP